jgi:hypothetical protein
MYWSDSGKGKTGKLTKSQYFELLEGKGLTYLFLVGKGQRCLWSVSSSLSYRMDSEDSGGVTPPRS